MRSRKPWLPRQWASRVRYTGPLATSMTGTHGRRIVLHTEGVDRPAGDPEGIARYVNAREIPYHATWDPRTGRWCQMIGFNRPARALENGGVNAGVGCNITGEAIIQICVVGWNGGSWSRWPRRIRGAWVLDEIAESWDVPWVGIVSDWSTPSRSERRWWRSGFTCHAAAPGNHHTDGAGTNFRRLRRVARLQNRRRLKSRRKGK